MKNTDLRMKFILFLSTIADVKEGTYGPKWIGVIRNILYPLTALYERNSRVRYIWESDSYILRGVIFPRSTFDYIKDNDEVGFKVSKREDGLFMLDKNYIKTSLE